MSYANREMVSENIIEKACEQYKRRNLAVINKVPTPVVVLRLRGNRIVDGFYEKKGTINYIIADELLSRENVSELSVDKYGFYVALI